MKQQNEQRLSLELDVVLLLPKNLSGVLEHRRPALVRISVIKHQIKSVNIKQVTLGLHYVCEQTRFRDYVSVVVLPYC